MPSETIIISTIRFMFIYYFPKATPRKIAAKVDPGFFQNRSCRLVMTECDVDSINSKFNVLTGINKFEKKLPEIFHQKVF